MLYAINNNIMKLKKVIVKKLFGIFDHTITVNNSEGITIIIGENGLGKTVLLEMIESFFKSHFFYFNKVNFDEVIFEFDDNISWKLQKEESNDKEETFPILNLTQKNKNKTEYKPIPLINYEPREMDMIANRIARNIPHLQRVGPRRWRDMKTGELIHSEELAVRYGEFISKNIYIGDTNLPKWFTERHEQINVSLIETQRLLSIEEREEKSFNRTVEKYSKDLTQIIKSHLTESTELSSKLDRTYPNRLIERIKASSNITIEALNKELANLEKKRELLDVVGLIEIDKDSNILEIQNPQDVVREVLMLYVEDSFKKIEIFDRIARKIEIFLDIINKRFKHKKLIIDKEKGFFFKSTVIKDKKGNAQEIPINKLSSGEQNELVLFYFLLFKTKSNSLILIDEPEVSLHISWQNSFIEDLKQITKLNSLDVVIATHSPDIISDNWDLKVELKGLE
jgi:predicted ATP-binding protein involved in virulence